MKKTLFPRGNMPFGSEIIPDGTTLAHTGETESDSSEWIPPESGRFRHSCHCLLVFAVLAWTSFCNAQSSIQIAWDPNPEPDVAGYYVYLGTKSTNLVIHKIIRSRTVADLTGLSPSKTYFTAVQAFNSAGLASGFSSVVSFETRPPGAIIGLTNSFGIGVIEGDVTSAGNVEFGGLHTQRFNIQNLGTETLTGLTIASSGPQAQDFSVSSLGVSSLPRGGSTEFTVTFDPSATGSRTANVHITSNDTLTPSFDFSISGNSATDRQLYDQWAADNQLSGEAAKPHSSPHGDNVQNVLKYASNLAGNRSDIRSLKAADDDAGLPVFTLDRSGPQPVFIAEYLQRNNSGLVYKPKISGNLKQFELMTGQTTVTPIDENWSRVVVRKAIDPAVTPSLYGVVEICLPETISAPAPEIAVTDPSGSGMKSDGSTYSFGAHRIGGPGRTVNFTITNEGANPLTGIGVSNQGPHREEFLVTSPPDSTLAAGESMTFSATYLPSARGVRSSSIRILNDDPDESEFEITLTAIGNSPADLYANWAAIAKLGGTNASASAIPHHDGVANLLKYAFNLNATRPDIRALVAGTGTSGLPSIRLDRSGPQPQLVIEFLRRKDSGLIYTPQISTLLSDFHALTETPTVTSIDGQWERVVLRRSIQTGITPALFGRVTVTLP